MTIAHKSSTVLANDDERGHSARLRELLLRPVRNYKSSREFAYPIIFKSHPNTLEVVLKVPLQSSIIGPNVIQAIINKSNNNWTGFPFLFALCAAASITIWFIDVEKGRENCRKFVEERNLARVVQETGATEKGGGSVPHDAAAATAG